jgi:hypothetical protein
MGTTGLRTLISTYKFDKNSHLIMKAFNFVPVMEMLSRIFFLLLPLFFYSTATSASGQSSAFNSVKSNDFNPFEENGKFGLKNTKGQVIIPAEYDKLGWSNGTFSIVENVTGYLTHGQWGLINLENHKITKAEFTDLSPGGGTLIVARKKLPNSVAVKSGCVNTAGKIIVPFSYDGLSISSLRAIVYEKKGNQFRHGLIDLSNKLLIPLNYQVVYPLGSLRYAVVSFENKTAIFSEEGKQLTNFLIDSISSFRKNYAVIFQNQRQGLMNRAGEIVLEPLYREVKIEDDGTVMTRMADSWLFLEAENKLVLQYNADSLQPVLPELYKINVAGKTQLLNKQLKPVSDLLFSSVADFDQGKAIFRNGNKTGIIRQNGSIAIEPRYELLIPENKFIRASIRVAENERWILLDSAGKAVTQRNYDFIDSFNGKFFPVKNRGFWGAMNEQGKEIVACVHDSLVQYKNDYIVVKFKGQYGIINTKEDWIITPRPHELKLLGNDMYMEELLRNRFFKTLKGDVIYFTQNPIEVKDNYMLEYQPSGWITKLSMKGVIVDRFMQNEGIEKIFVESEGYRAIKRDGKYGFIDDRARLRIANRYENVKAFSEGLAAAQILGKWGFINKEDKIAIQPVYDEVFSFKLGFAVVRQKNLFGVIDKSGKLLLPVRYEKIEILPTRRLRVVQNGLQGLSESNGQLIVNAKYDFIEDLGNGYIIVERDAKFGVITAEGLSTIPLIYDGIKYDKFHNQYLALKRASWEVVKF